MYMYKLDINAINLFFGILIDGENVRRTLKIEYSHTFIMDIDVKKR